MSPSIGSIIAGRPSLARLPSPLIALYGDRRCSLLTPPMRFNGSPSALHQADLLRRGVGWWATDQFWSFPLIYPDQHYALVR